MYVKSLSSVSRQGYADLSQFPTVVQEDSVLQAAERANLSSSEVHCVCMVQSSNTTSQGVSCGAARGILSQCNQSRTMSSTPIRTAALALAIIIYKLGHECRTSPVARSQSSLSWGVKAGNSTLPMRHGLPPSMVVQFHGLFQNSTLEGSTRAADAETDGCGCSIPAADDERSVDVCASWFRGTMRANMITVTDVFVVL